MLMHLPLHDTLVGVDTSMYFGDCLVPNLVDDPVFLLSQRFIVKHLSFANLTKNVHKSKCLEKMATSQQYERPSVNEREDSCR